MGGLRPGLLVSEQVDEIADRAVRLDRMPESHIAVDLVAVAAAFTISRDRAKRFEIRDDRLHGTLRDANAFGDVAKARIGLFRQHQQHVRVVAEEAPTLDLAVHRGV